MTNTATYSHINLNDGCKMPQLGLGVWKAADGDEVEHAVATALETGYRLIDTAAIYNNETGVGKAIQASTVNREDIFITTKLWNSDQGKQNVRKALETSLEKLQLDYVDLYLIHWPTPDRNLFVETWKEFEKLRSEGLVKSIGVSNFQVAQLETLRAHSDITPSVNQVELHPNFPQHELRQYAKEHGIHIESWSPIGGSKGTLREHVDITDIASTHSKSPAQIILRWHIQHGLIAIPKSTNASRIRENFSIFDFELSQDEMIKIDALDTGSRLGPDPDTMNTA